MQAVSFTPNESCSLAGGLRLRFPEQEPKPCIHPLVTPSGRVLSGFEPSDHRWHRGLWFAIKYVDEDNFWEEVDPCGKQVSSEHVQISADEQGCWHWNSRIHWIRPSGSLVFEEQRNLKIETTERALRIDWHSSFLAQEDLHLDRTPFTTWGGYSGLGWRACRELHDVRFRHSEGESESLSGDRKAWLAADGLLDGPFVNDEPAAAGLLMVVDPQHPRFPLPFYAKSNNGFTFMNPAFLFHEGMDVQAGEKLELRYRIVTVDGRWAENLQEEVALAEESFS